MKRLLLSCLIALLVWTPSVRTQGTVMPVPEIQFIDANGNPLSGGKLYTYTAGTTTPLETYNNVDLAPGHQNANPVILNSAGRATVYLTAASYLFVLKTSADVTVYSQDNIAAVSLSGALTNVTIQPLFGTADAAVVATSYPSGASFDKCAAGSQVFVIDSAYLLGTYALQGMLLYTGGGSVSAALVNLTDGSPDTAMVTISSSSATGARVLSTSITFPSAGSPKSYCVKTKVSSGTGWGWAFSIVRTG